MNSLAYSIIKKFYAERETARSKVPLMNHIDEGLILLDAWEASEHAKDAFCLHPIFQRDDDFKANIGLVNTLAPYTVALALEYRGIANAYLREKITPTSKYTDITISPLPEVNLMLTADKVQNRKDFEKYHKGTHMFSAELDIYFKLWLRRLYVGEGYYQRLVEMLEND